MLSTTMLLKNTCIVVIIMYYCSYYVYISTYMLYNQIHNKIVPVVSKKRFLNRYFSLFSFCLIFTRSSPSSIHRLMQDDVFLLCLITCWIIYHWWITSTTGRGYRLFHVSIPSFLLHTLEIK